MKKTVTIWLLVLAVFTIFPLLFTVKNDSVSAKSSENLIRFKKLLNEIPPSAVKPVQPERMVIASHKTKTRVVTFTHELSSEEIQNFETRYSVKFSQKHSKNRPRYVVTPQNEQEFAEFLKESSVKESYNNDTYKVAAQTTDWGHTKMNVSAPWNYTIVSKGADVVVAVIDSGIQLDHPDLVDAVVAGGYDYVNGDSDPSDDNGHGTHVAGIIAAADNTVGAVGVAPSAKILPLKVCNASGDCDAGAIADAIEDATAAGVEIINMSLGGSANTLIQTAVNNAVAAGIIVVSAAGNTGVNGCLYPGAYENVVCVGAIDTNDARGSFSNYGLGLDVVAPGVNILSTWTGGTYTTKDGTSMATAYYSGAAADVVSLIKSICVSEPTNVACTDIRGYTQAFLNIASVRDIGTPGVDNDFGNGAIDLSPIFSDLLIEYTAVPSKVTRGQTYTQAMTLTNNNPYEISISGCTIESNNTSRVQTVPAFNISGLTHGVTTYIQPTTNIKYSAFTFMTPITIPADETTDSSFTYTLSSETMPTDTLHFGMECTFDRVGTTEVEQYRTGKLPQTAVVEEPASLKNVYFTFGKFRYNKYASPSALRAGDTAYIKNFNSSKLKLLQVFLYDYAKHGNQGYTKSRVTSTSMYLRTNYLLSTGKRYAYVMKFQDRATGIIATKYFVVYTTKTWQGHSTL